MRSTFEITLGIKCKSSTTFETLFAMVACFEIITQIRIAILTYPLSL